MRRSVLDHGFVELLDVMGDDLEPARAARVSYDDSEGYPEERALRLTSYLAEHDHGTPFEMVVVKLRVKAPVVVWWHWVRHRIASYNLQSGRYTAYSDEVYIPDVWRGQSTANKQASSGAVELSRARVRQIGAVVEKSFALYRDLLDDGVAKEQARLYLPAFSLYHSGIVLMNLRSLKNFLGLRQHEHAQGETRAYADAIRELVKERLPKLEELYL